MQFPAIDPVFLSIGPLQFRWYGLMYVFAFVATYLIIRSESRRKQLPLTSDDVADMVFYGAMGVVLGGRLGYILFYKFSYYLVHPIQIFYVWEGGMSFHGGFLGVLLGVFIFARRRNISFFQLMDMVAICSPVGLGFGRIGNFINAELYGRSTTMPWGIVFPGSDGLPRHPSQLYEAFLEGFILFFIILFISRRTSIPGVTAWAFCAGYGFFRFIAEFFRQPDDHIGYLLGIFSMGQLLSFPMFLLGIFMVFKLSRRSSALAT